MSHECVIAEFSDRSSLKTAIEILKKADFESGDYSVVTKASDVNETSLHTAEDTAPSAPPAEQTMGASTLMGGTLGAVLGTATMIGPMLVAGPLAGMAVGAVGGSFLSAVENWGVNHGVGEDYERKVEAGSCLIVIGGDDLKTSKAERLLMTAGPSSLKKFKSAPDHT